MEIEEARELLKTLPAYDPARRDCIAVIAHKYRERFDPINRVSMEAAYWIREAMKRPKDTRKSFIWKKVDELERKRERPQTALRAELQMQINELNRKALEKRNHEN